MGKRTNHVLDLKNLKNRRKMPENHLFSLLTVGIEVLAVFLRWGVRVRMVGDVGDGQESRPGVGLEWGSEDARYWTSTTSKSAEKGKKITGNLV